jgi:ATP-dependent DNA helicase RecQ
VTLDIGKQLGANTLTFRGTLARTSLTLSVVPGLSPLQRYAWIADALDQLPGSGIVYVLTVAEAERLAAFLRSCGHAVDAYSGQTDADTRLKVEDRLRHNQVKAVVATSALGMGYDKPDLGFCVHVGSPSTRWPTTSRWGGRAGRWRMPKGCCCRRMRTSAFGITSPPRLFLTRKRLTKCCTAWAAMAAACWRSKPTRACAGAAGGAAQNFGGRGVVDKDGTAWRATGVPYVHDTAKWTALAQVRQQEAGIMRQYAHGAGCLMAYLQTALDDPSPAPCGRCSVCTGHLPFPGLTPSQDKLIAARDFLRGMDVDIEPRKRWPAGVGRKGTIRGFDVGRAVAFADDPGWVTELQADAQRAARGCAPRFVGRALATLGPLGQALARPPGVCGADACAGHGFEPALGRAHRRKGAAALARCVQLDGRASADDVASTPVVAHLGVGHFSGTRCRIASWASAAGGHTCAHPLDRHGGGSAFARAWEPTRCCCWLCTCGLEA